MFIVVLTTCGGKVCESFATYEEARRRVEVFAADALIGVPLIFQELPDGSQRLVREDGKPLQWHRLPEEEDRAALQTETVPLIDEPISLGRPIFRVRNGADDEEVPPLPMIE